MVILSGRETLAADAPKVNPSTFRHVVGHLASGVTVVTTRLPEANYGMTASSVTSLSVEPPMMLACLNNATPTTLAVARAGRFGINILGQGHGYLAQQFAVPSDDKFCGVSLTDGVLDVPLLADALACLECRVEEQVMGGTHTIFLGRVEGATANLGSPLTYFRGGFGRFEFARDDDVYQAARQRVLDRAYPANAVISLEDMAYELGVDKAAIFYALTRLAAEGLVRRDADRGYVIVPFDSRTSDEAFDARRAIELGVIAMTIGQISPAGLAQLREHFAAMATLIVDDRFVDFSRYLDANYLFHETFVSLAGNGQLTTAFARLGIKGVMARSFGATPVTSRKFIDVHRVLLEAFEAGDADAARAAVDLYATLAKQRACEVFALTGGQL